MIKRHTTFYVSKIKPLNFCGKEIGHMVEGSSFEPPFEIEPTEGEHDFNKCDNCKKNLNELKERLTIKFNGNGTNKKAFPFCCTGHSNLENIKEFNRAYFVNVPEMVAKKFIYTNQHITNNHSSENWYKKITDYIYCVVESFGEMPTGCGESLYLSDYFYHITYMLKKNKDVPTDKKNRILEYINSYFLPNKKPETDFHILLNTHEKWLKEFPFELKNYFGNLKQHFEKHLPLLNGNIEVNIYSGLAKAKLHTESSLIEALINLTKELLNKINVRELVEQGIISDLNKHRFELESESLRIDTDKITKDFSKGELQYIKALKKWLQLHKEYFKEITPLLKALPPQPIENNGNVLAITNNFDSIKIIDVYNHFKKGLVEKRYLTEGELISYLKAAFEQMAVPETLFKIKDAPTKFKTMKVFHEYYKNIAGKPHGKQKKYAALLGNYFEGFTTDNVSTNFNK